MTFSNFRNFLILIFLLSFSVSAQTYNDATLARVRQQDQQARVGGKLPTLSVAEHAYRAEVYFANRAFPEAREHARKLIETYPNDNAIARALFVLGRSFMWERDYERAVTFLDEVHRRFPDTKDGREGLAFKGASLVRLGKSKDAAKVYEQYTVMYPNGERIESSYLNVIDALREAEKYSEAAAWVEKTKQRFPGTSTETNAVFARLRMEIGRKNWNEALKNADQLRLLRYPKGTMTNPDEVTFLRAFVLEKLGRREDAINAYFAIPDNISSYYGGLATERLNNLVTDTRRASLQDRQARVRNAAAGVSAQFPALYRDELLREAASRRVDPRFVLSIMKQESSFKANAKSPAAARGLLQLTVDTSAKYTAQAKITNLQAEDLYRPSVNIALGSVYLAELQKQFPNLLEAVAASYNGGEDNAERWLKRANSKEPFMFTAEVGFAESKDYVFKVLGNYRVYRELYTEDLRRK
jgi:soluble lytic murein transglycosylase